MLNDQMVSKMWLFDGGWRPSSQPIRHDVVTLHNPISNDHLEMVQPNYGLLLLGLPVKWHRQRFMNLKSGVSGHNSSLVA